MAYFRRLLQSIAIWRPKRSTNQLEKLLSYRFKDNSILERALTHKSVTEVSHQNMERLEFLGDAVLSHVISAQLYRRYKQASEGELTRRRSALVNKDILFHSGESMGLHRFIRVNRGVKLSDARVRRNLVGDAMEALIGALFLDGGIVAAEKFILGRLMRQQKELGEIINYKGQLIEYCHQMNLGSPRFRLIKTKGPEHDKKFVVQVKIRSRTFQEAQADNKKTAEQEAAELAIEALSRELN
ncbi:MAG: ribonuclease III [Candidatus Marinimicrobia bacterium]|nr:ribonuclease III [Candidatus Neomarinimicrobiota bacterium]